MLSSTEIQYILSLIAEKEGPGYSNSENVAKLQGKLSLMLEMANRFENRRNKGDSGE